MKTFTPKTKRMISGIIVILIIGAGGRALIMKKKKSLAQAPRYHVASTLVKTATVYSGDLSESHDYLSSIQPLQSASISARLTATIENVMVNEGKSVEQGQPVITLDHRQIDSQVAAVKAQIKQTQADLQGNRSTVKALDESYAYWNREADRGNQLAKDGTIPRAQVEATMDKRSEAEGKLAAARQKSASIDQQIRSLEARLGELETTLSYCRIESPFSGVVASRLVDPGDQAAPGKTLLVIESAGTMSIVFDIPQTDLPVIKPGLPVFFKIGGENRTATITQLYPSLNRARMMRTEVVLDQDQARGLTSGQYLTATVIFNQHKDVSLIPSDALIEGKEPDSYRVFVVQDGKLTARNVQVLGMACARAAVEGVQPGEQVVVHSFLGWARLSEGMTVEAQP